jgi:streptogramin lyase
MRSRLQSLLVSALSLALASALSLAPPTAAQSAQPGAALDGVSLLAPPMASAVLFGNEGARLSREARRSDPRAVATREAARSRFTGLTPHRAALVAKAAFPELIERPAGGAPSLPTGQRIRRYPTDHAAEVALPGAKGVVESIAPIARISHGRHLPLDLRLTRAGEGFAPVRSDVGVSIPTSVADGVSLPALGVSLTPVDAHGVPLAASAGELDGAAVLWRDADRGTVAGEDLLSVAKALPAGFELTTMLLSARSPGDLHFRVGMPSGAHLRSAPDGSVGVVARGATLAVVSPASARDAEGSEVPVSMVVRGNTLDVSVDLAGDYLYPIAVDPEVNDSQLALNPGGKRSNWEFFTSNSAHFSGTATYEGPGVDRLETKGTAEYAPTEWAYWGYETHGVSKIYEIKTETSAKNKLAKIESFLEFLEPGGARETKKMLSNEFESPEYENKAATLCAANASKVEECLPGSGKAKNSIHFQQSATGSPSGNWKFSDTMKQGIVSISEPAGTHSTTSYNTTSPTLEFETEVEGKKEKVTRQNVLAGSGGWLTKSAGAFEAIAKDTGIGVAVTKLEYESAPESWTQLYEHDYLNVDKACKGVQCYETHFEQATLPSLLPDGEQKIRYKAEEAISGTQSLSTEGKATVKVDTAAPHDLNLEGLPYGTELSEKPYKVTGEATDGEGSTVASSGIKWIALYIDGHEFGTASSACTVAKGKCTVSYSWTVNGSELGAGQHDIELLAIDKAGNESKIYEPISIRHSTPVALGPGSVDLESGDFALGATDASLGSGLSVGRSHSSRAATASVGPFGPEWNIGLSSTESLVEVVNGSVILTSGDGSKSIFAALGEGKFQAPTGDSNLELTLEENKATKQKLAYYLKDAARHTSVKFTQLAGAAEWVPTLQEGTVASQTVTYTYQTAEAIDEYAVGASSKPDGVTPGPDGNMWFVTLGTGKIGKITPSGGVTEYATGFSSYVNSIVTGPDGNLWFTNTNFAKVGKITPTGTVTEYTVPGGGNLGDITVGPDGNLWFASSVEKIDKVTTAGVITEYPLPAKNSPNGLTVGPDGNLWFTNWYCGFNLPGVCHVGKMTTSGVVTEYALTENSPVGITAGPDGNLWFAGSWGAKATISKVTTAGAITEYPLAASSKPQQVTVGSDGNMWFTERSANKIGRITKAGVVSEFSLPSESSPADIAPAANGNLWFAEEGTNKIGTISTTGRISEPIEELAPKPAGVSCAPELKAGCRALKFKYATATTAAGEAPAEWGEFKRHLTKVLLDAYDPVGKKMQETAVAEYQYDKRGRLRAEWDPRITPALKTTYGYDEEGHVTAMSPPGQEPWLFTYGASVNDAGTGRLLKAMRAPASAELWKGEALANTEAPKITGAAAENTRLAVSNGVWSGAPATYGYQWKRCNLSGAACTAIPGATNPNYTPVSSDVGKKLMASVAATSAAGTSAVTTAVTTEVQNGFHAWVDFPLAAGSGPQGVTKGPDSNVWYTNFTSNKIGKITTSFAITEYALPAGSGPTGVATGPDGNVWYTNFTSNKVGKITTLGVKTEYALPAGSGPKGIVAGPDGNLWYANYTTSKVGKITTTGTITEYALPAGSHPEGIAAGPDGKLWYTDRSTNRVGKITTTGTIVEYALPASSAPNGIVAGPDGNMWFTEAGTAKVGKATTAGVITNYSVFGLPEFITVGSDGNLWATSSATSKLLKITTSGVSTPYTRPGAGTNFQGITTGADGHLWFAEFTSNKIGDADPALLVEGAGVAPQSGETINYNVPVSGAGAPHAMSGADVAKWGQKDVPDEATAIIPPDEAQSWPATSYKRATVYYLDEQGRQVNIANPSATTDGAIATSEYNEYNDVIRTLSPANRATALAAGATSAEVSKLLDTQSTFNGEGAKEGEVSEPGTRLIETLGPQHQVKYTTGGEQKESLAREHKEYFYDQGAPGGATYRLLTETADLAQLANHEEVEVRTTRNNYSGQSNLGWQLRAPTSTTIDPEGLNLTSTTEYDPTTGQVKETRGAGADKTLSYATKFGETGTEAGKLKTPWGVAVNSEGKLWVVDTGNNRVEKFGPEGAYISTFGAVGSGTGQFKEPEGIALDSAGHIWVADTGNNRLQEFTSAGVYMASVGSLGTEAGQFKAPAALAFDPKGNMWVADTGNSRVEKFDKEAKYVSQFGSPGSEPGLLSGPKGIAVDGTENVWVADTGNNRIEEYSKTGSFLRRVGSVGAGEGQLNTPLGMGVDASGNVWVVDSLGGRAESFSPKGAYVTQIAWKGTETGQLTEPRSLAFDATGKLWVTDSSNNRLEQWSKGPNAHDQRLVYYSAEANTEGYASCGLHPEWAGLLCETLPAKQPELLSLPKLPVTTYTYNMYNEPETTTETFGATTRTNKATYDAAGRRKTSETTASAGTTLPKIAFEYNKELGKLEKQTAEGEARTLKYEFNRLGQLTKYADSDENTALYKYFGAENDYQLEEVSDSSNAGASHQTYSYDVTTKLRTKLVDSAAGTFTANYDATGRLSSVAYPYLCKNYTYNAVGEITNLRYIKTTNCAESGPAEWYSDSSISSVHGEMLGQTSTLAGESYTYDAAGRLTESQETPEGEGCTVRGYTYDVEGNRASSVTRAPGIAGVCQSEGGTVEGHNYDEGNRLADAGIGYDGFGNVTSLPAADAEGHELATTFYVDGAVASQSQNGVTNSYLLDPEGRVRETVTGAKKVISHYDAPGEGVAWTSEGVVWTRNIVGIDGGIAATQTNGETPVLQLQDIQGNVAATIGDKAGETELKSTYNSTEFGVPNAGKAPPKLAWLGSAGVESALPSGVVTYGSTSYVPQTARALQGQQVQAPGLPGGSGAGAAYTSQEEPWNMQGAAAAGAEAPGLEAAREQAAMEAAIAAAEAADPPEVEWYGLADARSKGEKLLTIATAADVINAIGSIPGSIADKVIGLIWDKFTVDFALDWFHQAGAKLRKCSFLYGQGIRKCKLSYNSLFIGFHLPVVGDVGVTIVNLYSPPNVEKCYHSPSFIGPRPPLVCVGLQASVR